MLSTPVCWTLLARAPGVSLSGLAVQGTVFHLTEVGVRIVKRSVRTQP